MKAQGSGFVSPSMGGRGAPIPPQWTPTGVSRALFPGPGDRSCEIPDTPCGSKKPQICCIYGACGTRLWSRANSTFIRHFVGTAVLRSKVMPGTGFPTFWRGSHSPLPVCSSVSNSNPQRGTHPFPGWETAASCSVSSTRKMEGDACTTTSSPGSRAVHGPADSGDTGVRPFYEQVDEQRVQHGAEPPL